MKKRLILLSFLFVKSLLALDLKTLPLSESVKKKITDGELYVTTDVTNPNNDTARQSFSFKAAGLHKRDCRFVLRKLSLYENYSQYISAIKQSRYDEQKQNLYFLFSAKILPVDFSLTINLPRIKTPGIYPFTFNEGFLKDLKGEIHAIQESNNRCLFYAFADWQGKNTGFNNTVFSFFSKALIQISMENLFRISNVY